MIYHRCKFLNDLLKHAAEENILAHELLEPYLCNTALIQASREHHSDVVQELLSRGARVHATNSAGWYLFISLRHSVNGDLCGHSSFVLWHQNLTTVVSWTLAKSESCGGGGGGWRKQ